MSSNYPDLLSNNRDWDQQTIVNTIKGMQKQILDLQRAGGASPGSAVAALIGGLTLAQAPVKNFATVNISTSFTPVVSVSLRSSGGLILLFGTAQIVEAKTGANTDYSHDAYVVDELSNIVTWPADAAGRAGSTSFFAAKAPLTVIGTDTPLAGAKTYTLGASYANLSTSGTPTCSGTLIAIEVALEQK